MSQWFRFYNGALDDPKVQNLPGELFKTWVNLLCVASRHDGRLPMSSLAFMLRLDEKRLALALKQLTERGLIDVTDNGSEPHNWHGRQYKAGVSTERVKRFRERARNGDETVSVTVSGTPPDNTDAETEQKQSSEPTGSAAVVPFVDARTALFGDGLETLSAITGRHPSGLRSVVGKWLKVAYDDASAVLGAIRRARDQRVIEPIPWIEAALRGPPAYDRDQDPAWRNVQ